MTMCQASGSPASRAAPSARATASTSVSAPAPRRQGNPLFGNVRNTFDHIPHMPEEAGLAVALINFSRPC
jgi:hypothetical protein